MARTKGATSKPKIADYLSQKDRDMIVAKALELARGGDTVMIKLLIEQIFGKALQPIGGDSEKPLIVKFDDCFTPSTKGNS